MVSMAMTGREAWLLQAAVDGEIARLADSFGDDYEQLAKMIEMSLVKDPTAAGLDPPKPDYWRAVMAELRRRSADSA
jgi:hypothetical protein